MSRDYKIKNKVDIASKETGMQASQYVLGSYPLGLTMLCWLKHFWNASLYQSALRAEDIHRKWNQQLVIHPSQTLTHPEQVNEWLFSDQQIRNKPQPYNIFWSGHSALSGQVSLSFPELFPDMLREALVSNFTSSQFLNGEVDWLWGTVCISHRRRGTVTFLKTGDQK